MSKSFVISMGALAVSTNSATQARIAAKARAQKKSSISTDSFFEPSNDVFSGSNDVFAENSFEARGNTEPKSSGRMPQR